MISSNGRPNKMARCVILDVGKDSERQEQTEDEMLLLVPAGNTIPKEIKSSKSSQVLKQKLSRPNTEPCGTPDFTNFQLED